MKFDYIIIGAGSAGCVLSNRLSENENNKVAVFEAGGSSDIWKVKMPLAFPEIILGVNQTLMMGLSMLVITALVGTRDLGQETLIALSKVDPGRGITAGICVAFIAITVDRLINAWSYNRKLELGLN